MTKTELRLVQDDIEVSDENDEQWNYYVTLIKSGTKEQAEQIKRQIIQNQEIIETLKGQITLEEHHILLDGGKIGNVCEGIIKTIQEILSSKSLLEENK